MVACALQYADRLEQLEATFAQDRPRESVKCLRMVDRVRNDTRLLCVRIASGATMGRMFPRPASCPNHARPLRPFDRTTLRVCDVALEPPPRRPSRGKHAAQTTKASRPLVTRTFTSPSVPVTRRMHPTHVLASDLRAAASTEPPCPPASITNAPPSSCQPSLMSRDASA